MRKIAHKGARTVRIIVEAWPIGKFLNVCDILNDDHFGATDGERMAVGYSPV